MAMKATSKLTLLILLITAVLGTSVGTLLLVLAHSRATSSGELTPELQKQLDLESRREAQAKEHWIPVVIAQEDIPAHAKITSDMVALMPYPKDLLTPAFIEDRKDVEGRITLVRVKAKKQIRSSDLLVEGQTSISYDIPDDMQTIAISADEINAVGVSIKAGDRVDILLTKTTQTILQSILVVAVTDSDGKTGAKVPMILVVKPEEAELLGAANRAGSLRAMLNVPHIATSP